MKEESYIEKKQEEVIPRSISFRSSFWIVLGIHLFGGIGLMSFTGGTKTANAADKKFLESKESQYTGVEEPTPTPTPSPSPSPSPTPQIKESKQSDFPKAGKPKIVAYPKIGMTQSYTIKKGDTLYSICKKYRMNFEKLKQINNIKDPTKIYVGQTLKFL